jgi:hypothetical protein
MMTTIAIVPRMYTNIMDNPSQIVAGAKVKRGDRKGRSHRGERRAFGNPFWCRRFARRARQILIENLFRALICGNFGGKPIAASPEHMLAE